MQSDRVPCGQNSVTCVPSIKTILSLKHFYININTSMAYTHICIYIVYFTSFGSEFFGKTFFFYSLLVKQFHYFLTNFFYFFLSNRRHRNKRLKKHNMFNMSIILPDSLNKLKHIYHYFNIEFVRLFKTVV